MDESPSEGTAGAAGAPGLEDDVRPADPAAGDGGSDVGGPSRSGTTGTAAFLPTEWTEEGVAPDRDRPPGPPAAWAHGLPSATAPGPGWSAELHAPPARRPAPEERRWPGGWRWAVVSLAAALLGALVGGGIVAAVAGGGTGSTTVKEISAGPALLNGTTDIQTVIAKVLPAVVSIDARSSSTLPSLFGGGSSAQDNQGTGMIITSGGEVVTNNHVIAGATSITVTLFGSLKALPATLIDTDPINDIALLQIANASNLPTVSYGNSDNVQVGDAVVAIGNALGLSAGTPTVTQGIISARGRTVQASDASGTTTETLTNMFQTDAAINPGNSGGPLVDSSGRVIGMNTAVASSANGSAQAQNIGFAIPANRIGQLLPELRARAVQPRSSAGSAYLGVSLETLTPELRSAYNFVPAQGAVVLQVDVGSPADTAGLQQGDVVVSLDGRAITSADQLVTAVQQDRAGQTVRIGLYRGQNQFTVSATLGTAGQSGPSSSG